MTDLFWLCNNLLGKTLAPCHKEVCEFFVHKDPDAPDFETFARNYNYPHVDGWGRPCPGSHESLLELMRSGLKSAIDICDKVQWIICFPDIRIRIVTDVLKLSQDFVSGEEGVVSHFVLQPDGNPRVMKINRKEGPSLFQILFPEHAVMTKTDFSGFQEPYWTTPARRKRALAPTITAGSVKGSKTGTHCDVLVFDDAITPENLGSKDGDAVTSKSIAKNLGNLNTRISNTLNLVDFPGFVEFIGTPQHPLDYLSQKVETERKAMTAGLPAKCRVLVRPCYEVLPGYEAKTPDKMESFQVKEWWPERMPFHEVVRRWNEPAGRDTVATQLLLEVSMKAKVKFFREHLIKATVPWTQVARDGLKVQCWDLAYSTKPRADFTVGGTAVIKDARFWVTNVKRGRFGPADMGREIAGEIFAQRPDRVAIEDSPGAQWLHIPINDELKRLGYQGPAIEWVGMGQGRWKRTELDADLLVNLLSQDRLLFSTGIPQIDVLYDELTVFPNPAHHDDIVAMLNLLATRFLSEAEIYVAETQEKAQRERDQMWEQKIHGYGAGSARVDTGLGDLISTELPE